MKEHLHQLCTFFCFLSSRFYDPGCLLIRKILEAVNHTKPGFVTTRVCRRTLALSVCHLMPLLHALAFFALCFLGSIPGWGTEKPDKSPAARGSLPIHRAELLRSCRRACLEYVDCTLCFSRYVPGTCAALSPGGVALGAPARPGSRAASPPVARSPSVVTSPL